VDAKLNAWIAARLPRLNRYSCEVGGLLIRPAKSSIELFDEGKALKHCVGRYAESYAKGRTDLYVIRKKEAPDEPFVTVEVIRGQVVQCRGYKNKDMTKEVAALMNAFEKRLQTRARQSA